MLDKLTEDSAPDARPHEVLLTNDISKSSLAELLCPPGIDQTRMAGQLPQASQPCQAYVFASARPAVHPRQHHLTRPVLPAAYPRTASVRQGSTQLAV